MFANRFNTSKCETSCRLCVGRIKLIRNKKTILLKQNQKDIAELLRNGKQDYARIRVEGVIREKLLLQAFEILELYLELITVRTQLIAKTKELPRDMMEAVSSIIYAAQRINDLPELSTLRTLFASKYGKEYAAEAGADATASRWQVNANLIRCLLVEAPQPEEKLAMLSEIAQEHGVEWDLSAAAREMGVGALGANGAAAAGMGGGAAAAAAAAGPYAAPLNHGSVPPTAAPGQVSPGMPGVAPHPQYANAQQAAHAAAQAAAQAHAAAQYAAQVAAMSAAPPQQASFPGFPQVPSAGGADGVTYFGAGPAAHGVMQQQQPPPPHTQMQPGAAFLRSSPSPPPPDEDALVLQQVAPPPLGPVNGVSAGSGGSSGGGGASHVGGYLVRSNSDIQRDYDAALGPPVKGVPAAPPPPPGHAAPLASAPPPAPAVLPSPPPNLMELKAPPSAPPPPPQVEDEYDELTRRLEALKKS